RLVLDFAAGEAGGPMPPAPTALRSAAVEAGESGVALGCQDEAVAVGIVGRQRERHHGAGGRVALLGVEPLGGLEANDRPAMLARAAALAVVGTVAGEQRAEADDAVGLVRGARAGDEVDVVYP